MATPLAPATPELEKDHEFPSPPTKAPSYIGINRLSVDDTTNFVVVETNLSNKV
jgi:hypothetical protein